MKLLAGMAAGLLLGSTLTFSVALADDAVALKWQMWTGSDADTAVWQHLADMVHAIYPNITVTLQTSSWNDYWTKLPVQAASGQLADIVSMQSLRTPSFYQVLAPIDDYVKKSNFDTSAFLPSIMQGMSTGGQLYGLPYDVGPWVIFYNKDKFDAAGIKAPALDWSMADFSAAAKKLSGNGAYGFGATPDLFPQWVTASGATYIKADGSVDFTQPEVIKAAEGFAGLVNTDKVAPAVPTGSDPGDFINGRFSSGNVAMYVDGPWSIITQKQNVKFALGIAPLPVGPNGESVTAGSGFGIAASSTNKDAAWEAVQVLTSPEAEEYLAQQGRALPARVAQQSFWFDVAAKDVTGAKDALTYAMGHSKPYPIGNNWNTVENLMTQYLPLALAGSEPAAKTMATIQSLATQ